MWDAELAKDNVLYGMIEFKTTMHKEQWDAGIPEHYDLQTQLYAYLAGTPFYHVAVAFLDEDTLADPSTFFCNDSNMRIYHCRVQPDFEDKIAQARQWYAEFIHDGAVSPVYDEWKDKIYLDILEERKNNKNGCGMDC